MRVIFKVLNLVILSLLAACQPTTSSPNPAIFETPTYVTEDVFLEASELATLRSTNFTLRANIPFKVANKLLEDLENLRSALRESYNINPSAADIHLDILIVDELEDFLAFRPGESSAAFYSRSALGPKIIVNSMDVLWDTKTLWEVMYHEYAHHFNATYLNYKPPLWLDEGLATYAAGFRVTGKNTYEFGYIDKNIYDLLIKNIDDWLPTDTFITELKKYPIIDGYYGEKAQKRQSFYYAQSWLIAHWMHHSEEGQTSHSELVKQLNKGENIRLAFPENIHDILQTYIRTFDPRALKHVSNNRNIFQKPSIEKMPLSEMEMSARLYLQVSQDGGGETHLATLSKLRNIINKDPEYEPYISAIRSLKLYQFKRYVAARQLMHNAARAKENDPDLQRLNAIFNIAMIPDFSKVPRFDAQDLRTHKAHIDKIIQKAIDVREGDDVGLDIERLHALGRYSQNLSANQRLSLDRILSSNEHKRVPILSLSLVYPLIAQQKFDDAEGIVTRARLWGEPNDLKQIEGMKEDIRLNRLYAQPEED